ncbi:transcription factor FER-LIKE IRON DEFICIENCY-INDUCED TRANSCRIPTION FACTOR-like [Prosopis cineraria]|uniref:transcription factor FER-LIKE IRON DEFICIENCY-INDUCED TRANSCRIPTION FACTOR-like n=1 Tax=Prosopis cineraria TaxID=364024 RepID=UPI00240F7A88|nr:transcription factor FER-LIKE IRON DEFICIENCY-INDUCED TRANSCRIPTION FACTOR-like [Prosopis cineraria]XP_054795815.1 transcription factor FER-LIKE IRON DEFICIENCY-INDUCED TRANSCRIPTION FACTOR-like [Prosopis cineraria]XP_054816685.1 transcription factor FER-LIKE IRON DEFICIENCY-INDUCED TRANSCRIPTION FACTOR-like [Prosopis cineraria]
MLKMDAHGDPLVHINDFQLHDFIDNTNFDQFINVLRGENEHSFCNFDSDVINGCLADNQFLPLPENPFEPHAAVNVYDPSSTLSSFSCFDGEVTGGRGEEENDSSATTITTTETTSANAKQKPKTDRSKTLISERRRRGRMKEKLYALRSLVPNITKMDKASIVGDAVAYVQELQEKAKKLKGEVKGLEASMLASENDQRSVKIPMKVQNNHINYPICKKIMQMDIFPVEERGFYVKLMCSKGEGVATSLYRALESLAGFNVQNSNLATVSERFLLTFTLDVKGCEPEINQQNLKLWVASALLNQGFEFITTFHA